jgi:hypothetical protein
VTLNWIDNYAGTWADDEGRTLIITPLDEETADVALLVDGRPMLRSWAGNTPAERLRGSYNEEDGPELEIDLGRPGFSLIVNYEFEHLLASGEVESLSVGISRSETDTKADEFIPLFGSLGRYEKIPVI